MEEEMFCYIHEGGELVKTAIGSVEYKEGRTNCSVSSLTPSCLLPLHNDGDIVNMFKFNDMFCHVYISNVLNVVMTSFALLGDSNIVQVHTFQNVHNHCLEDVALSRPLVRSTRASLVIDDLEWDHHQLPLIPSHWSHSQAEASLPAEVTVVTVEDAEEGEGVGGSGSQAPKPSSMKRYKRTAKRIVKRSRLQKSIVAIVSRMMNGQQAPLARAHFFEPSFLVVLSNLKSNVTTQVILERCAMYLDPDTLGHDLSSCDMMFIPVCENNHWHVHVVNFAAGRVEILSSLPLRRGNNISAATRRLSMALHKALHAYRIHMDADVSSFVHVQPHLLEQLNGSDCGVLVLKFMEFWNGATLTTSVAEDKMNMYRLQLVLQLVLNE
ncbi:hypothetical protein CK203_063414 [Vitis vinifera]|uniref:Ubiquitin-like protease family profile domain-containing protein n=1 Tax=Vitis vinifera TaxID=29760 RepID=A0A438G8Y2_VITVI|nr:hypothetical protein CK203_063414 [Vitis vinifera]